jgi:hypothetical protein
VQSHESRQAPSWLIFDVSRSKAMKCFYSEAQAVGTCKSCGRGLSLAFASEFPKGLACKNRCEDDVQRLIELIERNQKISGTSSSLVRTSATSTAVTGLFLIFVGAVFIYFLWDQQSMQFGMLLGGGMTLYGLYFIVRAIRLRSIAREKRG